MSSRSIVIGTAGHVDHGKSALVHALTGFDPDRLKEEQERGITIDLGFANLRADGTNLAFVDVPGHERFVRNMLAGAGGIDLVMLVVAADESVMPRTREHFAICRLLHVPAGLIVITKADLADAEMRELAAIEARELTAGSFLDGAPLLTVSVKTGEGVAELNATLQALAVQVPERAADRPARLPIDRVFTVRGFGTVVTGTLVTGRVVTDDELVIMPAATRVTVRALQVHGAACPEVRAGQRVAVNLAGVDVADVKRGSTLCAPEAFDATRRFDASIEVLPSSPPLRHGARLRFHQGTAEAIGRVAVSGPESGDGPAAEIGAGGSAYARIRLESPVVLTRGDRFIVRSYSPVTTVAGGVVLDPHPPRTGLRTEIGHRRFDSLRDGQPDRDVVSVLLNERGPAGVTITALIARAGLSAASAARAADGLCAAGVAVDVGGRTLVSQTAIERLTGELLAAIRSHHGEHPLEDGLPREEARKRLFARAAPGVFEHVTAALSEAGRIGGRERLALAGHQVSLTTEEWAALETIEEVFRKSALAPPDIASAAREAGLRPEIAERMKQLLVRRRRLVRLEGLYFHAEALDALKEEMKLLKAGGASAVDIATFKDRYAITRKHAIPLLEYLDRERVTRRAGDRRVIL
jgi:selenocysteine-specific elongation factor